MLPFAFMQLKLELAKKLDLQTATAHFDRLDSAVQASTENVANLRALIARVRIEFRNAQYH